MKILVDGKEAVLKQGLSFEYTAENRLFLGRDGYTLSIAFPMKDCAQNVAIFGHIERLDVAKDTLKFECAIIDSRFSLFGTLSIVKVSDIEIEGQFAEGRCEQTINNPFEETYINELDLGTPSVLDKSAITPRNAWKSIDTGAEAVALPWVNENYADVPNNWVTFADDTYSWDAGNGRLSWQPYLIVIAKRICDAIDYSYDFAEWENSVYRHLIICNTLPGSWYQPSYAKALPSWTVSEFFEKLELFLMCEFEFDHKAQSVKMRFSKNILADLNEECIEDVVDSYNVDVSTAEDTNCDYIASKRLAYKECSHAMWNYYSCDWFLNGYKHIKRYATLSELIEANKRRDSVRDTPSGESRRVFWGDSMPEGYDIRLKTVQFVVYAENVDCHFVFRSIGTEKYTSQGRTYYTQKYILQPINLFGSGYVEDENTQSEEIDFVPVCIMDTFISESDDKGWMMFLTPSSSDGVYDEDDDTGGSRGSRYDASVISQPGPSSSISKGAKEGKSAYYDEIYVAFWDGFIIEYGKAPYPILDNFVVSQDWKEHRWTGFSMRLHGNTKHGTAPLVESLPQIDAKQKFKFSWLSDIIPNPRAIFHIKGKRYLCEKITATFTEDGMSQLLKGEFYPLLDTED